MSIVVFNVHEELKGLVKELAAVLNSGTEFGQANREVHQEYDALAHEQGLPEFSISTLEYLLKTTLNEYVKRGGI